MEQRNKFFHRLIHVIWLVLVLFVGILVFPWQMINWGTLTLGQDRTITVIGSAQEQINNQIATFTAGVSSVKDKKDDAVAEVNQKMDEIVKAVKDFGVPTADIQTQNASIYQMQESYYDNGVQKSRPGQWSVNNSVLIALREVAKAQALSDLLSKSGANNVSGPMFTLDTKKINEASLLATAIDDARTKASALAAKAGAKLGPVVSLVEGSNQQQPVYPMGAGLGGGGGAVVEPGTSTAAKTITVTFKLQ